MFKKKISGGWTPARATRHEHVDPHHAADLAAQFTKLNGKTPGEFFGTFEYVHKKSKRKVVSDVFPFHNWAFQEGLHAENLGGDIELMLNKRALIGAFPWRYEGLEGCPAASSPSSTPATTWRRSATPRRRSWMRDAELRDPASSVQAMERQV